MNIDETLEVVNRVWQEISVLVFVHAVGLLFWILTDLISAQTVLGRIQNLASIPELTALRSQLNAIGLDLPVVVGAGVAVYVVLFQRLSLGGDPGPIFQAFLFADSDLAREQVFR